MFYYIGFVLFDYFLMAVLLCVSFYMHVKRFKMLLVNALYKIKCIIMYICCFSLTVMTLILFLI